MLLQKSELELHQEHFLLQEKEHLAFPEIQGQQLHRRALAFFLSGYLQNFLQATF